MAFYNIDKNSCIINRKDGGKMLRREGYFEFRLIKPEKCTTETKIKVQAKILDKGFVEELRLIFYQFDRIVKQVNLQYEKKEEKQTGETQSVYSAEFTLSKSGVYWFHFTLFIEGQLYYVYRNEELFTTQKETKVYPNEYCWKLEVKDTILKEYPDWKGRRIYQIIPDRFAIGSDGIIPVEGRRIKDWKDGMPDWKPDSDGIYRNEYFYGGNLQGIKERLPYVKALGFNAIYMNPICKSRNYHHYEAEDFWQIDPMLGNWKDLEELCTEAKRLDIKVICDMAFNHTSDEHQYFKSAMSDVNSPYRKFYIFKNGKPVGWYGYTNMPEINKQNPEVQKEFTEVLKKYINAGVDAFRMDLGDILPKEFLLALVRNIQKEYPHIIFINEMWDIATERENPQIFDGQTNSLMNYPLRDAIIRWVRWGKYEHFLYNFEKVYSEYPKSVSDILMNVISTHDTVTLMTAFAGEIMNSDPYKKLDDIEGPWRHPGDFDTFGFRNYSATHDELSAEQKMRARRCEKIALPILYTLPGSPSMLQGTENCMTGYKDPFCRKVIDWENPDLDMQAYIKSLNQYKARNIDILGDGEPRIRKIDEGFMLAEMYSEKGSIILFSNNTDTKILNNSFREYEMVFSENSTKDKIGEYGTLILRKDKK